MPDLNRLIIQINGIRYPITTPEEPGYVQELARHIDRSVRELTGAAQGASLNEALVLVALSYLDAFKKEEKNADNLRSQIAEYLEDAAKARLEAGEAKRELQRLEQKLGKTSKRAGADEEEI